MIEAVTERAASGYSAFRYSARLQLSTLEYSHSQSFHVVQLDTIKIQVKTFSPFFVFLELTFLYQVNAIIRKRKSECLLLSSSGIQSETLVYIGSTLELLEFHPQHFFLAFYITERDIILSGIT